MTSFLRYLASPEPGENPCEVCGGNQYFCECDNTPAIDNPLIVMMYHTMSKKRMSVERFSDKYFVMRSQNWVELE